MNTPLQETKWRDIGAGYSVCTLCNLKVCRADLAMMSSGMVFCEVVAKVC